MWIFGHYLRYGPRTTGVWFQEANEYWENVDLYHGTEHATGHLVYSRFWNKFLTICIKKKEPFKVDKPRDIQGLILFHMNTNKFVSHGLKDQYDVTEIHVINIEATYP